MFKRNFWVRPAFLLPVLLAVVLLSGCPDLGGPEPEPTLTPPSPTAPVITSVTPGDTTLTVVWGAVSGATSYEVYHNTTNTTTGATRFGGDITVTTTTITGLTNGTPYYVWVRAKNSAGTSGYSVVVEATAFDMPVSDGMYKSAALPTDAGGEGNDWYVIKDGVVSYYYGGDQIFAGQLVNYHDGVIIARITATSDDGPTVGKFYGLLCNDVTIFSFTGANANKDGGNNNGMDTLSAASTEYTSADGYFDKMGDYGLYAGTATVTGIDQSLEVTWTAVPGAENYEVYYDSTTTLPTSVTNPSTSGVTITGNIATITGLTNATAYKVWARAKTSSVTGTWVYQGSGTPEALTGIPGPGYFKGDAIPWDDGIGITETHFYQYDDGALGVSYGGDIVKHIPIGDDGTAGTLIIKITETGSWTKTVGNYYTVAYQNYGYAAAMGVIRIRTSSATILDGTKNGGLPTIAEAVSEYTANNGYFVNYGNYRKFREEVPEADDNLTLTGLEGAWSGQDGDEADYFIRIANPVLTWTENLYGLGIANHQFAGTIVETTTATTESGYIYIKVDFVNPAGEYDDLEVGKYFAIHWKDKADGNIALCAAYKYGGNNTGTDNLATAKSTYTVENDYFDEDYYVVIDGDE
jgi:hypothetical protein